MTNLSMLKPGDRALISNIGTKGALRRRLMDMGVLVGEEIRVEKVAPLGDPIDIKIKSYHLSLRKTEAEEIGVEVVQ
ncbi:FeoA family protein [Geomesophilobacter sediminis]|uniref:Ferrous iron transport protein A n=1 Tax=Geomesophilobacter sediminis TaxID=2798584 RepID=A0A8J7LXY6_9BACT|nr:FeoA family protein [Geomesophilobacter sediminis]MBJ6723892.1 ferrous iron transport protein A [Geomesophilobacter sediminis]